MKLRWQQAILLALLGVALLIWTQVIYADKPEGLQVDFLDIGQGDATLINLPNGEQALVDGGPDSSILSQISKYMPPFDHKIEHIILTHPHADHLSGLVQVLERYDVGEVIDTGMDYDSSTYRKWQSQISLKNIPHREVSEGMVLDWGDVQFEVLWPVKTPGEESSDSNVNNTSIVGRLVYGQTAVMLTGDAEVGPQTSLCELSEEKLKSDVLKVAHHGSQNGTVECFLQKVEPSVAVISVGKDNKYGHPHAAALKLLDKYVSEVLRTDEVGTIECDSDGVRMKCD